MATQIRAGAFRLNITPPLGICMEGSFGIVRARDVWEDLYANALVLDDGQREIVLISVDVCSIDDASFAEIRERIVEWTGIPRENVVVTATHTHSGPATGMDIDGIYEVSDDYVYQFRKKVASAARLAQLRKRPARLRVGRGENREHLFNRRLIKPDGSIVMNWVEERYTVDAAMDPTVDPELLVMRVEDEVSGMPLAHVVNWANHDNAAPGDIVSPDYSGIMADHLRAIYGPELVVLFLPGAAGDINWIDHRGRVKDPQLYKRIGKSLAGTVLEIEARMETLAEPAIGVRSRIIEIPERPYTEGDILVDETFGDPDKAGDFFHAYRDSYERHKDEPLAVHNVDLHVVTFGDRVALCTNPAELFTAFGLEIKGSSPYPFTLVAELTNGLIGYVPTREAFARGGYETRKVPGGSYMAIDTGERIVATWRGLLGVR